MSAVLAPSFPAEPPRQIYAAACAQIAEALAPRGFRFAKSGPHLTRTDDPFRYRIQFQSDRYNAAGEQVRLLVHALGESADAERWLAQSDWPFKPTAFLGGGQIGNLQAPSHWWSCDVADPATRQDRIDDAIARIETVILPFFDRLADPRSLAEEAIRSEILGVEDEAAVRLCYWQFGRDAAEQCLAFWVARYSRIDDFRAERVRVLAGGAVQDVHGDVVKRMGMIAGALRIGLNL